MISGATNIADYLLALRTLAYLKEHYKTHDETLINSDEIEAIDFILDENEKLQKDYAKIVQENCYTLKLEQRIDKAIEKLYCWGEALDPEFQKEMLKILKEEK